MTVVRTSWLAAASQSDTGRVRRNNEDLAVCDPGRGVFAVIDGVGGQAAGEVAAAVAQRVILERLSRPLGAPTDRVREAIALANNEIWKLAEEHQEYEGMTCVLTLALVADHRITIGHVGDSRCYKLGTSGIRKLTHDHSPVGEREDAHELTEDEAMRHPLRNEVFRDVGSAYRDKDDEGFVEVVEDTIESGTAMLLCTDGLTDMVSLAAIEHVVRTHAGDPKAVANELVFAANEAGGKDNVTVVYAEAPDFARAVHGTLAPGAAVVAAAPVGGDAEAERDPVGSPAPGRLSRATRWIVGGRTTWFACGTLVGVAAVLVLAWRLGTGTPATARTLIVGPTDAPFARIADAVKAARPGDVVELKPGTYAERVAVPDSVDLVARAPGTVTLTRDERAPGDWYAVIATGPGTISGIRIESTPKAVVAVGIRVSGADRRVELCDLEGPMRAGIELADARSVTIYGSVVHTSQGPAITIVGGGDVRVAHNTFVRAAGAVEPAISLKDVVRPILWRNVFGGYGTDVIRGVSPAEREQLFTDSRNIVFASEPGIAR